VSALRSWSVIAALALGLGLPATVHAFSDPALFAAPVASGGGGGRYFTGSRADGYACSVCHQGAPEPRLVIEGVPDKLETGTRYELRVHWDQPEIAVGLQLELATPSGAHPSVEVTPAAMLPAESRCAQLPDGAPAVYTFDVGVRRVVGVEDCGASMVAVSFIATGEPIDLSIGSVRSDSSGTADGDGVFERRLRLGDPFAVAGGGCSAAADHGGAPTWCLLAVSALIARRRRASVRGARPKPAR
jgi:uncharacterized protein (TIGR03382 family)